MTDGECDWLLRTVMVANQLLFQDWKEQAPSAQFNSAMAGGCDLTVLHMRKQLSTN